MLGEECLPETFVRIPLKTLNRHGLIAGATGTGKTKSIQVLSENFSEKGIPTMVMDIKGDLSGLGAASEGHPKIDERHAAIGIPFEPKSFPIEFLTISNEKGVRMRATVSEFGPVLFSKILDLNDTQTGVMALMFKYCDDNKLPLVDFKDVKRMISFVKNEGKAIIEETYGYVATNSINAILRKIIELEQQGGAEFFGERSFDVNDLVRTTRDGKGIISIFRIADIQDKPKLFSTFMLCLLAEVYNTFPEMGDADRPKLCMFIDEAHLIFSKASDALLEQIEIMVKLIRSKGVGIYFVTQNPMDVPDMVLSQLGMKLQHALRAFTAKDRKEIKMTAENYPLSPYYQTDELLTQMGIGEAAITVLNEKGIPTPLVRTLLRAPMSRMDILTDKEIDQIVSQSNLVSQYKEKMDRESAYELLNKKYKKAAKQAEEVKKDRDRKRRAKKETSLLEELSKNTMVRQLGRTVVRELTRTLLGVLRK